MRGNVEGDSDTENTGMHQDTAIALSVQESAISRTHQLKKAPIAATRVHHFMIRHYMICHDMP